MGHLLNPISLRIGLNRLWFYSWYGSNVYEFNYLTLQQTNIQCFLKKFFDLKIFSKKGYLFSHVNLLYFSTYIDVRIYIYKTINNFNFKVYSIGKISKILTKSFYGMMFSSVILKLKFFFYYYFSFFYFSIYSFKNRINTISFYFIKKEFFLIILYVILKCSRFWNFFNVINSFIFFRYNNLDAEKKQKLLEIEKKKESIILTSKAYNTVILKIFFWFLKFKFWKKISFFIKFFFNKFIQNYIILRFCKINYLGINIHVIGSYITKRLKQRFKVVELILPILRNLRKNNNLLGFKFSFCGRFSRKEMATAEYFSHAAVPFNTLSFFIDYTLVGVILKDSYCGIKIWLNRKKDKFFDLFFHSSSLIWKFVD